MEEGDICIMSNVIKFPSKKDREEREKSSVFDPDIVISANPLDNPKGRMSYGPGWDAPTFTGFQADGFFIMKKEEGNTISDCKSCGKVIVTKSIEGTGDLFIPFICTKCQKEGKHI